MKTKMLFSPAESHWCTDSTTGLTPWPAVDGQHKENFLVVFGDVLSHNISFGYLFFVWLVDFF